MNNSSFRSDRKHIQRAVTDESPRTFRIVENDVRRAHAMRRERVYDVARP
ncbi:hypothetical protein JQ557_33245 [Bradyrhizobium sp. U87765 SZCCT0131]|nr:MULTISPECIES: hypothetical protein [unclassified Bradyrhizobium]MBR1222909.1 hypothetical protein [Bradyrhizobium sp. U87765 SZCCT0131]MBR1262645.1 hypothetical protein [Bradyrhizobium sp. U87765 SZCCT0134]MBR1308883.1 hypothetical protein [Bradyrhizobium sp. U87765 SZCCT0110]MBR1318427.1 hypothetical protein [Bradyrhizobium sp. U87765 SZCCT0109]MBR1352131.1 hypothetical protein [Bradyrhizobium sp. U87765 SZCCT0048]